MALERKDVRAKLDADTHSSFKAICDHKGIDIGVRIEELIEAEIERVRKEVQDAIVLADRLHVSGTAGSGTRHQGTAGNRSK